MALDVLADFRRLLLRLIVAVAEKTLIAGKTTKAKNVAAKLRGAILINTVVLRINLGLQDEFEKTRQRSGPLARAIIEQPTGVPGSLATSPDYLIRPSFITVLRRLREFYLRQSVREMMGNRDLAPPKASNNPRRSSTSMCG